MCRIWQGWQFAAAVMSRQKTGSGFLTPIAADMRTAAHRSPIPAARSAGHRFFSVGLVGGQDQSAPGGQCAEHRDAGRIGLLAAAQRRQRLIGDRAAVM